MLYYKVKKDTYLSNIVGMKKNNFSLIEDELFTITELHKIFHDNYLDRVVDKLFTPLQINKNDTYFCFGCRFAIEKGGD